MTACYQFIAGVFSDFSSAAEALRARLQTARLPASRALLDGRYGVSYAAVEVAVRRWCDWLVQPGSAAKAAAPHSMIRVAGCDVHVVRYEGSGALPLLLVHGWPTSFLMFYRVVPALRSVCSELILVSMPGFGTSPLPRASWSASDSAELLLAVMKALGFTRYVVHGEDWGATVARAMGVLAPDTIAAVHVSAGLHGFIADGTVDDEAWRELQRYSQRGSAYLRLQAERPDSLAFGLADSPAGLLAWQLDKYSLWQSELGDDFGIGDDFIFGNATLYWLSNSAATSMRLYATDQRVDRRAVPPIFCAVPTAVSKFGAADFASFAVSQRHNNLVAWVEHEHGGHMAALDSPSALLQDLSDVMHMIGAYS